MVLKGESSMNLGDRVICSTGVKGTVIKIYRPTASEEQIMVRTDDGRMYHAPYHMWRKGK